MGINDDDYKSYKEFVSGHMLGGMSNAGFGRANGRKKSSVVFSFSSFDITRRELIASVTLVCILLIIGVMIGDRIKEKQIQDADKYNKAIRIENDTTQFQFGMNTSVGNAFVYGDLIAVDAVSYPELNDEYIYVRKEELHKERHEETVTVKDDDGESSHEETRIYYEWETVNTDEKRCKEIQFCNVVFPSSKIKFPKAKLTSTQRGKDVWSWKSFEYVDVKYEYYTIEDKQVGTLFADLRNGTIGENSPFYTGMTITQTYEKLTSNESLVLFRVCWFVFIIAIVFGFYYLDNRWLEG